MSTTWVEGQTMLAETCWHEGCGIAFAMPRSYAVRAGERGFSFFCPNGHKLRYGKGRLEQLEEQLETERNSARFWREQTTKAERQTSAARGQVTKIKNRIKNGVCPFCNRTFKDVAAHMESKHSEHPAQPQVNP